MVNSLALTLIKVCSPGVPDFYQGTEVWDFSLVDPDNRRPVDFVRRGQLLAELKERSSDPGGLIRDLLKQWHDGRIKLWVTWQSLNFRRERPHLFRDGRYIPLPVEGPNAEHVCAFARVNSGDWAILVVPRWPLKLNAEGQPPIGKAIWRETAILFPEEAPACLANVLTGEKVNTNHQRLRVSDALALFPVALLHS
jgi:(1->4)-alpha-D-glucan 1-alpha-D-glucosylmutase